MLPLKYDALMFHFLAIVCRPVSLCLNMFLYSVYFGHFKLKERK